MRYLNRYINFFCIGFLLILLSGCQTDSINESPDTEISLRFNLPFTNQIQGSTFDLINGGEQEGIDELNENKLTRFTLYVFHLDGSLLWAPKTLTYTIGEREAELKASIDDLGLLDFFNGKAELTAVVVANLDLSTLQITSLSDLESHIIEHEFNTQQPDNFVMIAKNRGPLSVETAVTMELRRKASKIVAHYPIIRDFDEADYSLSEEDDAVAVRLVNYYNEAYLLQDSALPTAKPQPEIADDIYKTISAIDEAAVFYSYAADWSNKKTVPTYLEYRLKLIKEGESVAQTHTYTVSLEFKDKGKVNKELKPNHLYEITPYIKTGGGESTEQPIEVTANYLVKDWTTFNLESEIIEAHYFVVKEREVVLPNIDEYYIEYATSTAASIVEGSLKVWYNEYTYVPLEDNPEDPYNNHKADFLVSNAVDITHNNLVEIELDKTTSPKRINIKSSLPINYSPRYIEFQVKDELDFTETIRITQYPSRYITGRRSEFKDIEPFIIDNTVDYTHYRGSYSGNTNAPWNEQKNFNIFTIHTIAGGNFIIGNPSAIDEYGRVYTRTDKESNQLVSPKFVIASQRSIYPRTMYNHPFYDDFIHLYVESAKERCAKYTEGGYDIGTWRLPTEAEIKYVNEIQNDENSIVKNLLAGRNYWSGAHYKYYNFMDDGYGGPEGWFGDYTDEDSYLIAEGNYVQVTNNGQANGRGFAQDLDENFMASRFYYSAYVRCVRDVY